MKCRVRLPACGKDTGDKKTAYVNVESIELLKTDDNDQEANSSSLKRWELGWEEL